MKLTFCGGVGMVTGSNFLLEEEEQKILVDCGLAQGGAQMEALNWKPFAYDPASIGALAVTHAHIDHIGRIPKLVRDGFRGRIISTRATKALAEPMLIDSMELLRASAEKHGRPELYNRKDVEDALRLWEGVLYHDAVELGASFELRFRNAGHILGAGIAQFSRRQAGAPAQAGRERSIAFTGDLGSHSDLLDPAEFPAGANYLVMESVYGDRTHDERERHRDALRRIIADTAARGGTLLIPAFSTERTQDLLFDIRSLMTEKKIPSMPVFLDSPLAIKVTKIFAEHPECFAKPIAERLERGENIFSFPELRIVDTMAESRRISGEPNPKIILAGSGMSAGGRVLGHERELLGDKRSTLCIVGYQSIGSTGRRLLDGERMLEIMGERVRVRAKIEHVFSYSAHKDGNELVEFAAEGSGSLEKVFVVMGEPASSMHLAQRLRDYAGLDAVVPQAGESADIRV